MIDDEMDQALVSGAMVPAIAPEVVTEGPLKLDGLQLCDGCEDRFVVRKGFCDDCARFNASLEAKRIARKEFVAKVEAQDAPERLNCGVVEFEPNEPVKPITGPRLIAVWGGLIVGSWLAFGVAVYYAVRSLVWLGLWLSR